MSKACKDFEQRLDSRLIELAGKLESSEKGGSSLTALPRSPEGIQLADSVVKLVEFSNKVPFLFFPYDEMLPALSSFLKSPLILAEVEKSKTPVKSQKTLDYVRGLIEGYQELQETDDVIPPFASEDRGRFLTLLTLSLYAYVDVYTVGIIDRLMEDKGICTSMIELLEDELGDILTEKDRKRLSKRPHQTMKAVIKRHGPTNLRKRLEFALRSLGIEQVFESCASKHNLELYKNRFSEFVEIRHKVAHGNPCPPVEIFRNQFIDQEILRIAESYGKFLVGADNPIAKLDLIKGVMNWLANEMPMIGVILGLPTMSVVYPSMVDLAIVEATESRSERPVSGL